MKEEFEFYIHNYKEDNIENKDFIYYNGKITLHEENDVYDKFEKQINENDIKVEEKSEEESVELINLCFEEINKLKNEILNGNITISNILLFLESTKKNLMKIPYILSKREKEMENQLKACINEVQFIYDYLKELIKTHQKGIMQSEFGKILSKYSEEFNIFLSKFNCFKIDSKHNNSKENLDFEYIKKCEIPFENIEANDLNEETEKKSKKNEIIENKYLTWKTDIEQYKYDSEMNPIDKYENKKEKNSKKSGNKIKIMYIPDKITEEERRYLSMGDYEDMENEENNINIKKKILKNDLTDFKEEILVVRDYKKLEKKVKNLSATKFLKNIMKIVTKENQVYSKIRDSEKIDDIKKEFDINLNIEINSEFEMVISNSSLLLQNIISNLIRKKLLVYNKNKILPLTLNNSYLDILIDISATMSEEQRISSLLITAGLSLVFSKYGVKIRISFFHERDCLWALTDDFSYENIYIQLSRLRDALSCQKKIQSFPADALRKLKNSFDNIYSNKYCQILISNLVSGQIVDKNLNWNELGQRIIVFGLKSIFEENFIQENNDLYDNILKIPKSDQAQIVQEFFETSNIISQSEKNLNEHYTKLINAILDTLSEVNETKEHNFIREIKVNENDYNYQQNKKIKNNNNIENIKNYIINNFHEQKYFSQNILFSFSNMKLSKYHLNKTPKINEFPSLFDLEKLSNKKYPKKDYSMEEIIPFIISLLTTLFRQIMPSNIASGKIQCTSGGSLSIQGIKKWICSGFTYTNIFEKQGGKNKKKYYLSYVIDLSKSALLLCNYSHCIATIVLLLIGPSTVEDNDDIYIDVIINTINGVKIVDFNSKCSIFQNIYKINEIISIIDEEVNYSCYPGS